MTSIRMAADQNTVDCCRALVDAINNDQSKLYTVFKHAFSRGTEKLDERACKRVQAFDFIWAKLTILDVSVFEDVASLDTYFATLQKHFEHHIEYFCVSNRLPREVISPSKTKMLQQVVELYHVLNRYKFMLIKVSENEQVTVFAQKISRLNMVCSLMENEIKSAGSDDLQHMAALLNEAMTHILNTLDAKEYGKVDSAVSAESSSVSSRTNSLLLSIAPSLRELPTITKVKDLTSEIEEAYKQKNKRAEADARARLRIEVDVIKRAITALKMSDSHLAVWEDLLKKMVKQQELLALCFTELEQYHDIVLAYRKILPIVGRNNHGDEIDKGYTAILREVSEQTQAVCFQQSKAERVSLGIFSEGWNAAATAVDQSIKQLIPQIDRLMEAYHCPALLELATRIKELKAKAKELDAERTAGASKLAQAKVILQESTLLLSEVHATLTTHLLTESDYFRAFFAKHWPKMAIGGVSGAGTTATAAFLLMPLQPLAAVAIASAGAIIGASSGAGAGATQDYLAEAQPLKKRKVEEHPPKQSEKAPMTYSFWKSAAVSTVGTAFSSVRNRFGM